MQNTPHTILPTSKKATAVMTIEQQVESFVSVMLPKVEQGTIAFEAAVLFVLSLQMLRYQFASAVEPHWGFKEWVSAINPQPQEKPSRENVCAAVSSRVETFWHNSIYIGISKDGKLSFHAVAQTDLQFLTDSKCNDSPLVLDDDQLRSLFDNDHGIDPPLDSRILSQAALTQCLTSRRDNKVDDVLVPFYFKGLTSVWAQVLDLKSLEEWVVD